MAQIIKHRRGSVTQLKDVTARIGELVMATGSIGDLNGPFLFVGETEGAAGAYRPTSKIYQGSAAPTLTVGSHGSVLDGTPFYASGNESLYVLSKDGNSRLDLTGNIEGNLISGVTINNLTGSNANYTNLTGNTFTSTNANITSLTGSNANYTNLTGNTFTSFNSNITSLTGSNANISNITGTTLTSTNGNITSLTGSNAFVTNITGGTLTVTGTTNLNGDLLISGNTIQTGSIDLTGNIVLGGNITIGDQTTDIIQFGGEVSSSIIPIVDNSFDLGSTNKNWRNLHVSGTAYVNTLEAQQVNFNNLGILTDLVVSGSTYLGNGGDVTVISGSLYNDQLTEKRMVVVGADGLLTDYSGLTFDNGNLNLSGALEVTNIQGTGSLYLKPDLNDSRLFEIYNSAGPSGYTDIHLVGNADLNFFGDDTNYLKIDDYAQTATLVGVNGVIVSSSLQVTGSVFTDKILGTGSLYLQPDQIDGRYFEIYNTAASDVHIKSNNGLNFFGDDTNYLKIDDYAQTATLVGVNGVFISSSLNVTGSTTLNSTLEVKGAAGLNSTLDVTGSAILKSTLEVQGATGLNSTLDVTGSAILKSTLQVDSTSELKGAVGMNSSLDVTGSAQFKSTINVDGEATLSSATVEDLTQDRIVTVGAGGSLIDSSGFTYNGTLFKIGNGQFEVDTNDGDIRTSGSLTVNGGQTINGNTTINGVLTVTGNTQLQANLYVSGNLEVLGSSTEVHIQSQTIELDDNIIRLNAYSPFERYAGFEVMDSGSSGVSASLVWDSLNDYWMFVSASGQSSKLIGTTAGTYGSETSLTSGTIPKATGANTIGDSLLTDDGTTLSYNTNKFQVTSTNGNTLIAGNVTLSYSGGTDNGTKTSAIVFKNSSNVLGYVSTTVVTEVTDGLLGYKVSNGALVFSDLIDGGSY
jgi:hypothetical protein